MSALEQPSVWWAGIAAFVLSVLGFWYKTRQDLRIEIAKAEGRGADAIAKCEEIRLEMAEHRLETAQGYVTKPHLREVVVDLKLDADKREERLVRHLTTIYDKLDSKA